MATMKKKLDAGQYNLKDQVVAINRVTKVVKGGKNMSFAALVVVGDPGAGVVGYGSGKAKEVPQAIRKGIEAAKKNLVHVNLSETTIPHQVNLNRIFALTKRSCRHVIPPLCRGKKLRQAIEEFNPHPFVR